MKNAYENLKGLTDSKSHKGYASQLNEEDCEMKDCPRHHKYEQLPRIESAMNLNEQENQEPPIPCIKNLQKEFGLVKDL